MRTKNIHTAAPEGFEKALIRIGDSVFVMMGNCKNNWDILFSRPAMVQEITVTPHKDPFLTVHGNILYNYSYRSYIDTPFAQDNLQQHLVQTTVRFLVKNKYPLQLTVSSRSSNSPYFKNLTDVSFNFHRRYLLENIKSDLVQKASSVVRPLPLLEAEKELNNKMQQAKELQLWISSPARTQEFVEEKEAQLAEASLINQKDVGINIVKPVLPSASDIMQDLPGKDFRLPKTIKGKGFSSTLLYALRKKAEAAADQLKENAAARLKSYKKLQPDDSTLLQKFNAKKEQLRQLLETIKKEEAVLKQNTKRLQDSVNKVKQQINALQTPGALYSFMKEKGIAKKQLTTAQRVLLAVNQFGIGRSWVDYSELTVKNISIAGVNIEATPGPFYLAFAAGKVNYRFRDFIYKNNSVMPDQSVYIIRAGLGTKEKNNLIVSFYNGKKAVLNYSTATTPASLQQVLGFSAETRFTLNSNNYIIAEAAKSSHAGSINTQQSQPPVKHKTLDLGDRSNEAYSIKLFSNSPQTGTKITGYYKKLGENFQSFNLYPININQESWMFRVNQGFWKKRISLDAAIRKNDFMSPVAAPSFSSKTIFKSAQLSVRIPRYPFLSAGFYPTSQLSVSNGNMLVENQYNTLNMVMSYSYKLAKTGMNTNAVYTRFYNSSSDTAFIYYNAVSGTLSHSFFLGKLTLQTSGSMISQKDLQLFSAEQMLGWQLKNTISLSGALKWNRLNRTENLLGGSATININIKRVGMFQFNYERAYLPGYNRQLMPVDMGRAGFYREF